MTPRSFHAQIDNHGRDRGMSLCGGGCRGYRPEHGVRACNRPGFIPAAFTRTSLLTGRAFGLGLLSHSHSAAVALTAWRLCRGVAADRRAFGFLPRRLATNSLRRCIGGSRTLFIRFPQHVTRQSSNAAEGHLKRLSDLGLYVPKRSDRGVGSAQKIVGVFQNGDC